MAAGFLAGMAGGAGITIVIQAVDKFSKVFAGVNKSMAVTGAVITGLGIAGLAVSKNFIDTAATFESAFTGVRKTVELSEVEFAKLRQEFKDLSKEIPITFVELSSIGEIAGQLGVEGVDNIAKFTRTIADISVTTNLTSEAAATAFARIANVMNEPIANVDRMGSAIVDLGNNFATSEQEIVNMSMRIMGAGKTIGLSTQEVFGMSAALSALGIRSEMGGSAMSRAMIIIAKAVANSSMTMKELAEETGLTGDELAVEFERSQSDVTKFAKVSGISVEEFSEAWKTKPVEAMSQVVMGLKNITDSGGNTFGVLEDLDLKSIRITDTMLRLSGSEDGVTNAVEKSKTAWEENNALTEEAAKRYATTESQVIMLKNKFDSLKEDMGRTLIPTFIKLVDVLGNVIGWLEKHPTLTKWAIAALAIGSALAIVVGPLLILVALLPALSAGFALLSVSMGPITLVILAIAGAVLAVVGAIKLFKKLTANKEERKRMAQDEFDEMNNNPIGTSSGKYKKDTIMLNSKENNSNVIALNDFIVRPGGKIIKPSAQDTIIGTKNPNGMGGTTIILNGNIYGTDPDEMMEAFQKELNTKINYS